MISAQVGTYDVIKINNQRYATQLCWLTGLIVQNAENVQDGCKEYGKFSYIGWTLETLLNPTQFNYQLSMNKTYSGETTMICAQQMVHSLVVVVYH